jgi:hypothetical protein
MTFLETLKPRQTPTLDVERCLIRQLLTDTEERIKHLDPTTHAFTRALGYRDALQEILFMELE